MLLFDARLSFEELSKAQAEEQRALLVEVRKDKNVAAAEELLFFYSTIGWMHDSEVQKQIEMGSREVMKRILFATDRPNKTPGRTRSEVNALWYFGIYNTPRGNKRAGVNERRLRIRRLFGQKLTEEDIKEAITTQWDAVESAEPHRSGARLSRKYWPQTVGDLESRLTEFIVTRRYKGASDQAGRDYVRATFPQIARMDRNEGVQYPDDW